MVMELAKRKRRAYYGAKIKDGFPREQVWLQSEKLPEFLKFYVKPELLTNLENNSNHLICGRRGTGKTHLLGAFCENITRSEDKGSLCVMLSAAEFSITPSYVLDESLEFSRARYARSILKEFLSTFVEKFTLEVYSFVERYVKPRVSKRELKRILRNVDDKLYSLLEATESGTPSPLVTTYELTGSEKEEHQRGLDTGIGIAASTSALGFGSGLGWKDSSEHGNEEKVIRREEGFLEVGCREVRKCVLDVVECLNANTLYLLIDEWMQLDKTLNLGIQPYFAELLKRIFFNEKKFSVKIASVWHRTNLYDRLDLESSKGLELGEDIVLGADLDVAFLTEENEILEFFKTMLFTRLSYKIRDLKQLELNGHVDERFIIELFDNQQNFKALIAASHGIPRDFWQIFHKCAMRIKHDFVNFCVCKEIVGAVSREKYLVEKRKTLEKDSAPQVLWSRINDYMNKTSQNFFLVENQESKNSKALRKLVDEKLCHPIPSAMAPRIVRDKYKLFQIDYGNCIDSFQYRRRKVDAVISEAILPAVPNDFEKTYESYIVKVADIAEKVILCPNCNRSFSTDEPVYLKHKLCPRCGEHIT